MIVLYPLSFHANTPLNEIISASEIENAWFLKKIFTPIQSLIYHYHPAKRGEGLFSQPSFKIFNELKGL